MSENITNEPPEDLSPLQVNKALASQLLTILGYKSLANYYDIYRRTIAPIMEKLLSGYEKIEAAHGQLAIHSIPDKIEAGKLMQTAWVGTPASDADIIDVRICEPGAEITRTRAIEQRDKDPRIVTYTANTKGTETLIEQLILGLGFGNNAQTTEETMRDLRRNQTITLPNWKTPSLQITVTKPAGIKPEVANPIDAAYRIQIKRSI